MIIKKMRTSYYIIYRLTINAILFILLTGCFDPRPLPLPPPPLRGSPPPPPCGYLMIIGISQPSQQLPDYPMFTLTFENVGDGPVTLTVPNALATPTSEPYYKTYVSTDNFPSSDDPYILGGGVIALPTGPLVLQSFQTYDVLDVVSGAELAKYDINTYPYLIIVFHTVPESGPDTFHANDCNQNNNFAAYLRTSIPAR